MKNKDLNQKFQSKANTLAFLQQKLKKGKIEEIVSFTVENWQKKEKLTLQKIIDKFYPNDIIIRSSVQGEDSIESTEAGKYKSIQKISTHSKKNIKNSVNEVIDTYNEKGNENKKNQILIQKQTTNIITNGVVFTSTPENGSPYYVINFSDSKDTDNVTKGETSNLVKIFRGSDKKIIPQKWKKLIFVLDEIEKIFETQFLDIEFGITKKNVIIFQVRPLTTIKIKSEIPFLEKKVQKLIKKNQKKYQKLRLKMGKNVPSLYFSDMTDWNPAEIIGNNPNPLDYSLYDFLIMKDSWQKGRTKIGYNKIKQKNLMEKFGNKPYVNIVKSFNSLFPENFSFKLKNKLIGFYLKKLENNPHLHDKVEFDILFSCYDFTFNDRKKELQMHGFTKYEINNIKKILIKFTNKILKDFSDTKKQCIKDCKQMEENRKKIKNTVLKNNLDNKLILRLAKNLLEDCKKYGTINFSTMARIAFIGNILLKSLQRKNLVDEEFVNQLMSSISSPLSEIQNDLESYREKKISKKLLLSRYGHLRPGTYDITAKRYDENQNFLQNINFLTKMNIKNKKSMKCFIEDALQKNGIVITEKEFIIFLKDVIRLREVLKFEFTKNLSDALYLISKAGKSMGFSKNELAYLEINDIVFPNKISRSNIQNIWKKKIIKNKKNKKINEFLILPPLIYTEKDFEIINYNLSQPNFITTRKISSNIQKISNLENKNEDFSEKIIVIENADPGYDWIFSKNLAGLITKYGGIASHMAIRCAELGLPAAIGIGEIIFSKIDNANKILLDCENQQIIVLENFKIDQYMEEKRILKSLGYIK
jgi:phosphohistidine swiveling domain-containing protein